MRIIVALVDFSNSTTKLVECATMLTRAFGSRLILFHVVPPQVEVIGFPEGAAIAHRPDAKTVDASRKKLEKLCNDLAGTGLDVGIELSQGIPVENILEESRRTRADLIIMGSHQHGALYNLIVGSVTHNVLQHASCPVLVVPGGDSASAVQPGGL